MVGLSWIAGGMTDIRYQISDIWKQLIGGERIAAKGGGEMLRRTEDALLRMAGGRLGGGTAAEKAASRRTTKDPTCKSGLWGTHSPATGTLPYGKNAHLR